MTTLIPKFDLMDGGTTPSGAVNREISLKLQESISVKDFGATGDGVTNDTAAVQAAIDAVLPTGKALFFPAGVYLCTNLQLVLNGGTQQVTKLYGEAQGKSIIRKYGTDTNPVIYFNQEPGSYGVEWWAFEDLTIDGNSQNCSAIRMHHCSRGRFVNVRFYKALIGMEALGCEQYQVLNCFFDLCTTGVKLAQGDALLNICNLVTFTKTTWVYGTGRQADLEYAAGIAFNDCVFDNVGTSGDVATGGVYVGADYGTQVGYSWLNVTNCWFEKNHGKAFSCDSPDVAISIQSTIFVDNDDGLLISYAQSLSVKDSQFAAAGDTVVVSVNCPNTIVMNSLMYSYTINSTQKTFINLGSVSPLIPYSQTSTNYNVDQYGNVGLGRTVDTAYKLSTKNSRDEKGINQWQNTPDGGSGSLYTFQNYTATSGNVYVGGITFTGGAGVNFVSASDSRLKQDIKDAGDALAIVKDIKVREFTMKANKYKSKFGFIAQELINVYAEPVTEGDDGTKIVEPWAVDYSKLVPLLTKAIQELKAEVDALKAK